MVRGRMGWFLITEPCPVGLLKSDWKTAEPAGQGATTTELEKHC